MNCPTCKNPMKTRKVHQDFGGPMGKARFINETFCPYCEWKGTTGPGKQLRDSIKDANEKHKCGYCGSTEDPVEDHPGGWPSCPHCKGV